MTDEPASAPMPNSSDRRDRTIVTALVSGVVATILVASGSIWQLYRFSREAAAIERSYASLAQTEGLLAAANELQRVIRVFGAGSTDQSPRTDGLALQRLEEQLRDTRPLPSDDPGWSLRAQGLRQLLRETLRQLHTLHAEKHQNGFELARSLLANGAQQLNAVRDQVMEIRDAESVSLQQQLVRSRRDRRGTMVAVALGSGLSVFLAGFAFVLIRRDLHRRSEADAALRDSEARAQRQLEELQAIYDSIPIGLCVLDRDLRYVRINRHLADINGLPATEQIGKTITELVPELALRFSEVAERIFRTGEKATDLEFSGASAAAPHIQRTLIEQWLPLKDSDGRIIGINVVAEDITDRKRAADTLRRTAERLEIAQWGARSAAWDWDVTSGAIDWSPEMFELFGLDPSRDEPGFAAWQKRLHPDDRVAAEERIRAALRDRRPLDSEYRIRLPDGTERWINALGRTTLAPSGQVARMAGLCIDVTDRKEAESHRRVSEEMLRFALDSTRTGLWQWDVASGTGEVTPQNQRLFGLPDTITRVSSEDYMSLIHDADRERVSTAFSAAAEGKKLYDEEFRICRVDGQERWIHSIGNLIQDGEGRSRFIGISRDVTDRKLSEKALLDADRRKDEFIATLSHELRNPLAPLSAALELLRNSGDRSPADAGLHEMMERQVSHLVRLVDDLLEVSRITRGKIQLRKERVDLAAIVRHAVETSEPLIRTGGHELTVSLPAEPLIVNVDPVRIAQVLSNLLNNAAHYMDAEGRIHVSAELRGMDVRVSVRDEGIGIASDDLPHVFDLFGQIEGLRERAPTGLGIGLALVRSLVEMHGGRAEAYSAGPGQGSEFVVYVPVEVAEAPAVVRVDDQEHKSSIPRRILIVDDNRDAADALSMLLRGLGSTVQACYDGFAALDLITDFRPDAVLLDIGMPGMDGYELAQRIRQLPDIGGVALIAITGWGTDEARFRTHKADFAYHLVKPVKLDALRAILSEVQTSLSHTPRP